MEHPDSSQLVAFLDGEVSEYFFYSGIEMIL